MPVDTTMRTQGGVRGEEEEMESEDERARTKVPTTGQRTPTDKK
jgi:hypothetical protein